MDEYIVKKYQFGKEFNSQFNNNTPFENIVFNDFFNLNLLSAVEKEFPMTFKKV